MTKPGWRQIVHVVAIAAVMAVAAAMWHHLPTPDDVYAPFDIDAGMGEQATGRAIAVEVTGARIAPRIRMERLRAPTLDALGMWVAIDSEAMTTLADEVLRVDLVAGPNTYGPTERIGVMPLRGSLTPGIVTRSSWVFDVPAELVAPGEQHISLRVWVRDGRMDSRLVMDIPLNDSRVSRSDLIVIEPATQVGT
jgi:hypothetical protein